MKKTVLIVDDSLPLRKVMAVVLQIGGYHVIEADDGRSALSLLDGRQIDLVVSDVHMPYLDGIGFMRELKKMPAYAGIPVIMLTSDASEEKRSEGEAAGASAWLRKPVDPHHLLDTARRLATGCP